MVELIGKIRKVGNSYGILIPVSLIRCKVLEEGKEYLFKKVIDLDTNEEI